MMRKSTRNLVRGLKAAHYGAKKNERMSRADQFRSLRARGKGQKLKQLLKRTGRAMS